MNKGITVRGLRKSFGDKVVLDGIDLDVEPGTIFALLGPNGAGKTTVVRILSTVIRADGGGVSVGGHDLASVPAAIRDAWWPARAARAVRPRDGPAGRAPAHSSSPASASGKVVDDASFSTAVASTSSSVNASRSRSGS